MNRDWGDLTHLAVALALFVVAIWLPKWALFGVMNTVMWYLYEYGQLHMSLKRQGISLPWHEKINPFAWSKNHFREFMVPAIGGWIFAIGLIDL